MENMKIKQIKNTKTIHGVTGKLQGY